MFSVIMEQIEQKLADLEKKEIELASSLSQPIYPTTVQKATASDESVSMSPKRIVKESPKSAPPSPGSRFSTAPQSFNKVILILRTMERDQVGGLETSLKWLMSHGPACYSQDSHLVIVVPMEYRESNVQPLLYSKSKKESASEFVYPGFEELKRFIEEDCPNKMIELYGFGPYEMTRGCVGLVQKADADLTVITKCKALGLKEYESPDYCPLLEEIVLKEAVQPVVLLKA